ncbi:MAG TPA: MFS transporter [Mycobacteriales bacterium]|nr:MFS transporter [Mycobacteriales bacterium]HVX70995.1 MFS transporter [Mycobacteriales bacterium]
MRGTARGWLVWGAAVTAYAVAVFQRGSLGVAAIQAHHQLHASAAEISLFVVLQLAVYAGMQVPVGAALDRFGSRRMLSTGAIVMATGQACLALAHGVGLAILARVLVGAGDAMSFISVLRLVGVWFPARQVPVLTQLTAIVGQLGQIAAAYPLVALLTGAGWQGTFVLCAIFSCGAAALVMTTVQDHAPGQEPTVAALTRAQLTAQVAQSWRERGTKLGLWAHFTTQFSGNAFALLWGYPFLVTGEGLSKHAAGALLTLLVVVGMAVGPMLGRLTGGYPFRRSNLVLAIVLSTISVWTAVLVWPGRTPLALLVVLIVVLGSNGPGSMVGIDFARTYNPLGRAGSASGIVNMGGFIASLAVIAGIGGVLSAFGAGPSSASIGQFKAAFCVQYVAWGLGLIWIFRHRGTLRAELAAEGRALDPLHRAAMRRWRARNPTQRPPS